MKTILINATAACSSGALTILRDLISYIESNPLADCKYILCTSINDFDSFKKIKIKHVFLNTWLKRILWDYSGLQKWCIKNEVNPDIIISLQNTSTRWTLNKKLPQLVYYHQPLPFYAYKFKIYSKNEFVLFLYQKFYNFFVNKNNKHTHYVVQLPFFKESFLKKNKNISADSITVIRPNLPFIKIDKVQKVSLPKDEFKFIYPATLLRYKNHEVIINALVNIKNNAPEVLFKIKIYFTISELPKKLQKKINRYKLTENIIFLNSLPYQEVLQYYKSCDALLFPSQIETFGLPLIEASSFGLPVIAADLPYAREVLEDYNNKYFINPIEPIEWANTISNFNKLNKTKPLEHKATNSWSDFMDIAYKLCNIQKIGE